MQEAIDVSLIPSSGLGGEAGNLGDHSLCASGYNQHATFRTRTPAPRYSRQERSERGSGEDDGA